MSRSTHRLNPEVKVISSQDATIDFIASDASLDCYDEIVVPSGARFERFRKNAPFVNSHDYHDVRNLLGSVVDFRVQGGQVIERVKFARDIYDLANLAFKLYEGGFLKAVSIGFMPLRYAYSGTKEFADMVKELGLSAEQTAQCRCIHREWEQIELSACIIGANPNALVKAYSAKALNDEDMHKLGFDDGDAFDFLTLAAQRYDSAEPMLRVLISRELERIHRARNLSPQQSSKPLHQAPDGDDRAKRQAEQQQGLRELVAALKSVPRLPAHA